MNKAVLVLSGFLGYFFACGFCMGDMGKTITVTLEYAPAPVDNPLKGLVPYAGDRRDSFPHSMEFQYFPLSDFVKDYGVYEWRPLEDFLDAVSQRGNQAVFRVFLEYPGIPTSGGAIPDFLIRDGLVVHRYSDSRLLENSTMEMVTPDYEDGRLRRVLQEFIRALGARYDGDPRIGFITAGLLGYWGEWHTHPHREFFASKEVQKEIMDAYEASFKTTPILLRYPAGENHDHYAANAQRFFGYHDDSFAWTTINTGRKEDLWSFMTRLEEAGEAALEKWETRPIGGEIRPEAWGKVFDVNPGDDRIQDFLRCVETTHVTWLMDTGMFSGDNSAQNAERVERAKEMVRRMGYEFHVSSATITPRGRTTLQVTVQVENRGVAPFYYAWSPVFALLDKNGKIVREQRGTGRLSGLLPGEVPASWSAEITTRRLPKGTYIVALTVPNPIPNGKPIRFANKTQDQHAKGWLSLAEIVR